MKKLITSLMLFSPALVSAGSPGMADEDSVDQLLSMQNLLLLLALLLASTAIILHFIRSGKRASSKQESNLRKEVNLLKGQISDLWRIQNNYLTTQDLVRLTDEIYALKTANQSQENNSCEISWEGDNIRRHTVIDSSFSQQVQQIDDSDPSMSPPQSFYAKMADLENGFSTTVITKRQDGEQLFEIHANEDCATYRITDDIDAQRYALAEPELLSRACELFNQPFKGCRMIMKREGILNKAGNQWHIQSKVQVEFK